MFIFNEVKNNGGRLIFVAMRLNIIAMRLEITVKYVFRFKYNYNNHLRIKNDYEEY